MNTELEYQKETGLPSRKRNTGNPHSYTNEYIEWLEQQVKLLHLHNVNCCALLNEVRQYRKEQAELFEWTKKNGHPKMASFDEGGLNACDKLIAVIEKHCS